MKTHKLALLLIPSLFLSARADEARFFRVAGPVASAITAVSADGHVTWTNAPINGTFTVQTAVSLIGPSNWVDYIQVAVTNPVTTNWIFDPNPPAGMALIPAGGFTMGDSIDNDPNDLPLHSVYVSAFYIDRYEVTKALWDEVYVWATNHGYSFTPESGLGKASNHPVHTVSWFDAVKWCNARSEKEGRTPAYYTSAAMAMVFRTGQADILSNWVKWNTGYRLATEAEWEKAARGGSSGRRFPWSDTGNISHSRANYYAGNISFPYNLSYPTTFHPTFATGGYPYTNPVGYFAPNGYGLYEMTGNVLEWCWDWDGVYSSDSQADPLGSPAGWQRVNRGGAWNNVVTSCGTADRSHDVPSSMNNSTGFRSVLPSGR